MDIITVRQISVCEYGERLRTFKNLFQGLAERYSSFPGIIHFTGKQVQILHPLLF